MTGEILLGKEKNKSTENAMKKRHMRIDFNKFHYETMGMRWEIKCIYHVILGMIGDAGGRLPDHPDRIKHYIGIGMSQRHWNTVREELIERGKIRIENGHILNG